MKDAVFQRLLLGVIAFLLSHSAVTERRDQDQGAGWRVISRLIRSYAEK